MRGPKPRPLSERLFSRVSKQPSGCWDFTGSRNRRGYGSIYSHDHRKHIRAHRASWYLSHGEVPPGVLVCHKCDNPSCVNPEHLFLGTRRDNVRDMLEKGRSFDRRAAMIGERRAAKLNWEKVREIRRLAENGCHVKTLAQEYGVTPANIRAILRGKTWVETEPAP